MPESAAEQAKELRSFMEAGRLTRGPNDAVYLDGMPVILSDESRRARKASRGW